MTGLASGGHKPDIEIDPSECLNSGTSKNVIMLNVWSPLGSSFQGSRVDALVEYQGDLIAGGTFESSDSIPLNNVARWNGSTWEPMGDGLPGSVEFLAVSGDQLIANGVALWNGTQWFNIGAGLEFYSGPDHLISQDGCIIMTGMALAGRPKSMLKWDGDAWSEFIYGAEGTFGKFNSDYYCAAGAPVFGGQRPARWIASGQSAVVAISPPRRHGLTVSIAQNPIAGSLDLLLGETSTPRIVVDIFDVAGRRVVAGLVATSSAGRLVLSPRELTDSGSAIQNGVYLVRVSDGNVEGIAKFVVLR